MANVIVSLLVPKPISGFPVTSPPLSLLCPFHLLSVTPVYQHTPAPGPLHLLFCLPGMSPWLLPSLIRSLLRCHVLREALSVPSALQAQFPDSLSHFLIGVTFPHCIPGFFSNWFVATLECKPQKGGGFV